MIGAASLSDKQEARVDVEDLVELPNGVDRNEWIASHGKRSVITKHVWSGV